MNLPPFAIRQWMRPVEYDFWRQSHRPAIYRICECICWIVHSLHLRLWIANTSENAFLSEFNHCFVIPECTVPLIGTISLLRRESQTVNQRQINTTARLRLSKTLLRHMTDLLRPTKDLMRLSQTIFRPTKDLLCHTKALRRRIKTLLHPTEDRLRPTKDLLRLIETHLHPTKDLLCHTKALRRRIKTLLHPTEDPLRPTKDLLRLIETLLRPGKALPCRIRTLLLPTNNGRGTSTA